MNETQYDPSPLRLTVQDYMRLGRGRKTFDAWLEAEGLIDRLVYQMDFTGEGPAILHRFDKPLRVEGDEVVSVQEPHTFKTPPPIRWAADRWVSC